MPLQKITKAELVQVCIRVFRRQGYYRTTMADLAEATSLTKGVFYHHFASKEAVMQAALQDSAAFFETHVFQPAYRTELPAAKRLEQLIQAAQRAFTLEAGGCFFGNTVLETANSESAFLVELKVFFASWQRALQAIFVERHSLLVAGQLAEQVVADVEGSLLLMQLYKDPAYLSKAFGRTRKLL